MSFDPNTRRPQVMRTTLILTGIVLLVYVGFFIRAWMNS